MLRFSKQSTWLFLDGVHRFESIKETSVSQYSWWLKPAPVTYAVPGEEPRKHRTYSGAMCSSVER
jgi:hypothetical protein